MQKGKTEIPNKYNKWKYNRKKNWNINKSKHILTEYFWIKMMFVTHGTCVHNVGRDNTDLSIGVSMELGTDTDTTWAWHYYSLRSNDIMLLKWRPVV